MSLHPRKALGVVIVALVLGSLSGPAPAPAHEASPPSAPPPASIMVTAVAKGPNHFNSSINVDLPAGGTATVSSPGLDNTMTKAKVEFDAPLSDDETLFKSVAFEMFQKPTPGKRLLHCIHLTGKSLAFGAAEACLLYTSPSPRDS